MKTLKPIIQTEEPDKYGRTVKVGITDGTTSLFFQVMSVSEVRNLRNELTKFLNHSPKPLGGSLEEISNAVDVGSAVKVRFEEFGMPDKHIPGRVIHPKRVYRLLRVTKRNGVHLVGKDMESSPSPAYKFHIEQIIEVFL